MPINGALYDFTDENLDKVPNEAGVYVLYQRGSLIYIGRSGGWLYDPPLSAKRP